MTDIWEADEDKNKNRKNRLEKEGVCLGEEPGDSGWGAGIGKRNN